ncbi:MAG TPA: hypothetical protein VM914_00190 [Pyrinomonadaceae bacterium]|nr:hypothetical protein [Pyrinomonadaceae bacterium]
MRRNTSAPLSDGRRSTRPRQAALVLAALAFFALACGEAAAQTDANAQREDGPTAAPPLRYVPDDVRRQLDAEARDVKARTKLALQLAEDRLARASVASDGDRFEDCTNELGVYEAIVADTIRYVQTSGRTGNKLRDTFKRIELTLRSHVPRIETLRRGLPEAHAVYAKATIDFVRVQRDQALSSFYDDSIIPEPIRPGSSSAAGVRTGTAAHPVGDGEKKPEQR